MKIFLISITVVSSVLMVIIILLQQGKGAELGAAFGRGAQGGLFESSGKATFLSRVTSALAAVFLLSSLALSLLVGGEDGVLRELEGDTPAAPAGEVVELLPEEESAPAETLEIVETDGDIPAAPADEQTAPAADTPSN